MTRIRLINDGGKLKARDVDSGQIVPLELGDVLADDVQLDSLERADGNSVPVQDDLDLQGNNEIKNASALSTEKINSKHVVPTGADESDVQAIVDNASPGDCIEIQAETHTFSGSVTVDKPLTIRGQSAVATGSEPHPDTALDNINGAVIEQTAAASVFEVTASGEQVNFNHLAIDMNGNAGNAIHGNPPDDGNGNKEDGIFNGQFRNIIIRGIEGGSYGVEITNPQHCLISKLKTFGSGGGLHLRNNSSETNFGNSVVIDLYHHFTGAGTAHGIYHSVANPATRKINLNAYIRPQVNYGQASDSNGQKHITVSSSTRVINNTWIGINLEGGGGGWDRGKNPEIISALLAGGVGGNSTDIGNGLQVTGSGDTVVRSRDNGASKIWVRDGGPHESTENWKISGDVMEHAATVTSDAPPPGSGYKLFYRSDLSPPELRAIDENGTVSTITQF